ncbi:hypothetical protein [Prosthecochloris sp. SCSIO W1103]|uniref:hypothetical protein n=1 Tax=Prosthecochloris sp. SCSIO W1103 TaxID=2992244 RepID=UPI00223D0A8E|nr:hypothetical protein [Prosthecochloris sp. SCSIO W1103]UZJ36460.1 hypothetical protein OO005_06730 [Prosthecochloris sp. SCSIO W1103]
MYIQFEDLIVNLYNKQRLEQTGSTSNPLHKPRRALSAEHHRHRGSVDCALIEPPDLEKLDLSAGQIPQSVIERFVFTHPACDVIIKPGGWT